MEVLKIRRARWRISIAVKAFNLKRGIERAQSREQIEIPLLAQRRMQPADHVHLGDAAGRARPAPRATISSIELSKACASRFFAAKAQNWQERTQMFE